MRAKAGKERGANRADFPEPAEEYEPRVLRNETVVRVHRWGR